MKKNIMNEKMNAFLRVRSYMRYSSVNQDDGFSIEYQSSEIEEFIKRQGMELTKAHVDMALTASKNIEKREAFFELVRDVQAGLVDVIVVYKMSRMFRNSGESDYYRRIFRKHGVKIISVTEYIDDDSSSGRLTTNILSNIDQYQAEVISEHVRSGMREMAKQGLFTGQRILIGYELEEIHVGQRKRKKFKIKEDEAPFIRRLFEMYANGMSCRQICKILRSEGIRTKQNAEFSENTLRRMLGNEFYKGVYRYRAQGYDDVVLQLPELAIIDDDLFATVQERKRSNDPQLKPRHGKRLYALTGKMVCGKCGYNYMGTNSQIFKHNETIHYNYYTCKSRKEFKTCDALNVRKEFAETETLKAIKNAILNDEAIETLSVQISEICQKSPQTLTDQIKELKSNERSLQKRYDVFVETFLKQSETDGAPADNSLAQKTVFDLQNQLTEVRKQLKSLNEQLQFMITPESVKTFLTDMLNRADQDDIEVIKTIFDAFVEKIVVFDDDLQIHLRVYPCEFVADKNANTFPFVALSAGFERIDKYKPKSRI